MDTNRIAVTINHNKSNTSSIVYVKNLELIAAILNADIYYRNTFKFKEDIYKQYDIFIVGNGTFITGDNNYHEMYKNNKNAKYIAVLNDYNISVDGGFDYAMRHHLKQKYDIISNFEYKKLPILCDQHYLIDLNYLIYNDNYTTETKKNLFLYERLDNLLYYGTFRKNRIQYFREYLNDENIIISTSDRSRKKFQELNLKCQYIPSLKWASNELKLFKYSLYIEDVYTHTYFNHMANRFYECVNNDVVLFFDKNCKKTINRSNLIIDDYFYIESFQAVKYKLHDYNNLIVQQANFKEYCVRQKNDAIKKIRNIFASC